MTLDDFELEFLGYLEANPKDKSLAYNKMTTKLIRLARLAKEQLDNRNKMSGWSPHALLEATKEVFGDES